MNKFDMHLQKLLRVTPDLVENYQNLKNILFQHLKIPKKTDLATLGFGGYGTVFWLPDKSKVLKITEDHSDAYACEIVRKKPDKNLIKIYSVFSFGLPYFEEHYGIVAEKLTPLSASEVSEWEDVIDVVRGHTDLKIPPLRFLDLAWCEATKSAMSAQPSYTYEPVFSKYFPILEDWAKLLESHGIEWGDLSVNNIMKRGPTFLIADLGAGYVSRQTVESLEID